MWCCKALQQAHECPFAGIGAKYDEASQTGADVELCGSSAAHQCHGGCPKAACRSHAAEQEHLTAPASLSSVEFSAPEAGSWPSDDSPAAAACGKVTGQAASSEGSAREAGCAPIGTAGQRSRAMSTESTSTAAGSEQHAGHQNGGADWAEAIRECKGRLNKMLTDCGMATLPHQV